MLINYILVFLYIKKHLILKIQNKSDFELQEETTFTVPNLPTYESENETRSKRQDSRYKKQEMEAEWVLTKKTILIMSGFCLAWLPYGIFTLVAQFSNEREKYITPKTAVLPLLLAKCSSIVNPMIYLYTNERFKQFIKSHFRSSHGDVMTSVN